MFQIPKGLFPSGLCDHRIILQANALPVNVRPCRYPHSQKIEIEIMVDHMLIDGLIEPSNSLFLHLLYWLKRKMAHGDFALIIGV